MSMESDLKLVKKHHIKTLASDMLEAALIIETSSPNNWRLIFIKGKNRHRTGALHRIYKTLANADHAAILRMLAALAEIKP